MRGRGVLPKPDANIGHTSIRCHLRYNGPGGPGGPGDFVEPFSVVCLNEPQLSCAITGITLDHLDHRTQYSNEIAKLCDNI
jgi:hypothetical protein